MILTDEDRRAATLLRGSLAFFGADASDLTDEQLAEAAVELGKLCAQAGVPAAEAAAGLAAVMRAVNTEGA